MTLLLWHCQVYNEPMNPFPDRIEELHEHLERRYCLRDRQATEILLASLLPVSATGRIRPWITVETDYPNRDMTTAWLSFGGEAPAFAMSSARVLRYKPAEELIQSLLNRRSSGSAGILVESEWRRPVHSGGSGGPKIYMTDIYGHAEFLVPTPSYASDPSWGPLLN